MHSRLCVCACALRCVAARHAPANHSSGEDRSAARAAGASTEAAALDSPEAGNGAGGARRAAPHRPPPLGLQLRLLLKRSWRQAMRDTGAIRLRAATNVQSAVVFGGIWWRLRRIQKSVPSRLGLLQVVAVYMSQVRRLCLLILFLILHGPVGRRHCGRQASLSFAIIEQSSIMTTGVCAICAMSSRSVC
jgi:hypothetical protein